MTDRMSKSATHGLGVDAYGGAVIDPTENVKALMEASIKSLTREAELHEKLANEKILRMEREAVHQDETAKLRAEHSKAFAQLRADHVKETREYDNDRWDKIRTIDMANAQATAKQILDAVNTYSAAQERIAQTLAKQVTDTAAAQEARNSAQYSDVTKRLQAVELSLSKGEGKSGGVDQSWKVLVAIVGLVATLLVIGSIGVTVVLFLNRSPQQSPVYVSPPATTVTPPPVAR